MTRRTLRKMCTIRFVKGTGWVLRDDEADRRAATVQSAKLALADAVLKFDLAGWEPLRTWNELNQAIAAYRAATGEGR